MNARGFSAAAHVEEEMTAIREEARLRVSPLSKHPESCRGSGFTALGGNAEQGLAGTHGNEDGTVGGPRTPARRWKGGHHGLD